MLRLSSMKNVLVTYSDNSVNTEIELTSINCNIVELLTGIC